MMNKLKSLTLLLLLSSPLLCMDIQMQNVSDGAGGAGASTSIEQEERLSESKRKQPDGLAISNLDELPNDLLENIYENLDTNKKVLMAQSCNKLKSISLELEKRPTDKPAQDVELMLVAARHGFNELINTLLEKGVNINSINAIGNTALMFATEYSHADTVKFLIDKGANVNSADGEGWTALMEAARTGNKNIVNTLLSNRADIDQISHNEETAISIASKARRWEIVQILLNLHTQAEQ